MKILITLLAAFVSLTASAAKLNLDLPANTKTKSDAFLISLDVTGQRPDWASDLCSVIYQGLNAQRDSDAVCHKLTGEFVDPVVEQAHKSGQYRGHVTIVKNGFATVRVTVTDWTRNEIETLPRAQFNLDYSGDDKFFAAMYKLMRNYRVYDANRADMVKKIDEFYELDPDKKSFTGELYDGKKSYRRAILEVGAFLGFGVYWYYADSKNANDWENSALQGIKDKISGEAIRFDDNSREVNAGHAFAGMMYYQFARANGLSQSKAFISAVGLSTFWETVIEFREILSVGDMIFTGLSGPVIGEVFYQVARSLRSRDSLTAKIFASALDIPSAVSVWLDRNKNVAKHSTVFDDKLQVEAGFRDMNFTAEIFTLPDDEKVAVYLPQAFKSNMEAAARFGKAGVDEFQLLTKLAYMGYMKRNLHKNSAGSYDGYEFIVSPSTEFEWLGRRADDEDFMIHARVLGAMVQMTAYKNGYMIRANYEFYGDFAMVNSYALAPYEGNGNTLEGFQGIVKKEKYYYGVGTTQRLNIELKKSRLSAGAKVQKTEERAINKHDRFQENVTKKFSAKDTLDRTKFWFSYQLTPKVSIGGSTEKTDRFGKLDVYTVQKTERYSTGRLTYRF